MNEIEAAVRVRHALMQLTEYNFRRPSNGHSPSQSNFVIRALRPSGSTASFQYAEGAAIKILSQTYNDIWRGCNKETKQVGEFSVRYSFRNLFTPVYEPIVSLVMGASPRWIIRVTRAIQGNRKSTWASHLLSVYELQGAAMHMLASIAHIEEYKVHDRCISAFMFRHYCCLFGTSLHEILALTVGPALQVLQVADTDIKGADKWRAVNNFVHTMTSFLSVLAEHGAQIPLPIRILLNVVHTNASDQTQSVLSLIFEQLICPALLAPEDYDLPKCEAKEARQRASSILIQLAKNDVDPAFSAALKPHLAKLKMLMDNFEHSLLAGIRDSDPDSLQIFELMFRGERSEVSVYEHWQNIHQSLSLYRDKIMLLLDEGEAQALCEALAPVGPPSMRIAFDAPSSNTLKKSSPGTRLYHSDTVITPRRRSKSNADEHMRRSRSGSLSGSPPQFFNSASGTSPRKDNSLELDAKGMLSARASPSPRRRGTLSGGSATSPQPQPVKNLRSRLMRRRSGSFDSMVGSSPRHDVERIQRRIAIFQELGRVLDLSLCSLTKLPAPIMALKSITTLNLSGNQLTEIPVSILHLVNLEHLDVSNNLLKSVPGRALRTLHCMKTLVLSGNEDFQFPLTLFNYVDDMGEHALYFLHHMDTFQTFMSICLGQEKDMSRLGDILDVTPRTEAELWSRFALYSRCPSATESIFCFPIVDLGTDVPVLKQLPMSLIVKNIWGVKSSCRLVIVPSSRVSVGPREGTQAIREFALGKGRERTLSLEVATLCTTDITHAVGIHIVALNVTCFFLFHVTSALSFTLDAAEIQFEKEPIASGATASVYRGEWRQRIVAAKIIKNRFDVEAQREAALLARLQHPNIIVFYGVCTPTRDTTCIVTEYINMGSLTTVLANSSLELDWRLRMKIALDTALGLAYIHSTEVIHSDIKSENILIASLDSHATVHARLCDFGVSFTEKSDLSEKEKRAGTALWQAPETTKRGVQLDSRSCDIWSFGMVMGELCTRLLPYSDVEFFTALKMIERGEVESMPPDTPLDFLKLRSKCLNMEPAQRPLAVEVALSLSKSLERQAKKSRKQSVVETSATKLLDTLDQTCDAWGGDDAANIVRKTLSTLKGSQPLPQAPTPAKNLLELL